MYLLSVDTDVRNKVKPNTSAIGFLKISTFLGAIKTNAIIYCLVHFVTNQTRDRRVLSKKSEIALERWSGYVPGDTYFFCSIQPSLLFQLNNLA